MQWEATTQHNPLSQMALSQYEINVSIPEETDFQTTATLGVQGPLEYPPPSLAPPSFQALGFLLSSRPKLGSWTRKEMTNLPEELDLLQGIEEVDLSSNQFSIIPPHGFDSVGCFLLRLFLSDNLLSSLHEQTLQSLEMLEELDLSYNLLRETNFLGCLCSLKHLNLLHNPIEMLIPGLGRLSHLRKFSWDWPLLLHNSESFYISSLLKRLASTTSPYLLANFIRDYCLMGEGSLSYPLKAKQFIKDENLVQLSRCLDQNPETLDPSALLAPNQGALELAVINDKPRVVLTVLQKLSKVSAQKLGSYCLARAISLRAVNIAKAASVIPLDVEWRDARGNSLLHLAFQDYALEYRDRQRLVKTLLSRGVSPNSINGHGEGILGSLFYGGRPSFNILIALDYNAGVK